MSFGLLTRRSDGTDVLRPDIFTVRIVAMFYGGGGEFNVPRAVSYPGITPRMFATCTPVGTYGMVAPVDYGNKRGSLAQAQLYRTARIPKLTCHWGGVTLAPPVAGGNYSGDVYIYVFGYL